MVFSTKLQASGVLSNEAMFEYYGTISGYQGWSSANTRSGYLAGTMNYIPSAIKGQLSTTAG